MRILLIEANSLSAQKLAHTMRERNIILDHFENHEITMDAACSDSYQAIIIGQRDGQIPSRERIAHLHGLCIRTPILVLADTSDLDLRLATLEAGADDYLVQPCNISELITRLYVLVRRAHGRSENALHCGELSLFLGERDVRISGERVRLTAKEYQILELLCLRCGGIVSKTAFLNHLYGGFDEPEIKIIDVFICKLRKKLNAFTGAPLIETVWGQGYRLDASSCHNEEAA